MTIQIDYRLLIALLIVLVAAMSKGHQAPPPRRVGKASGPGKPIRNRGDQRAGADRARAAA